MYKSLSILDVTVKKSNDDISDINTVKIINSEQKARYIYWLNYFQYRVNYIHTENFYNG